MDVTQVRGLLPLTQHCLPCQMVSLSQPRWLKSLNGKSLGSILSPFCMQNMSSTVELPRHPILPSLGTANFKRRLIPSYNKHLQHSTQRRFAPPAWEMRLQAPSVLEMPHEGKIYELCLPTLQEPLLKCKHATASINYGNKTTCFSSFSQVLL